MTGKPVHWSGEQQRGIMSPGKDHSYHRIRARDELERARQASDPSIANIHRQLAALHRRRMLEIVHLGEPQVDPRPLIGQRPLQQDMI
jgi:hypothetical protein